MHLFATELGYDLNANPKLAAIQEIMISRHLYAHNSGLIDDKFIAEYLDLTGIDVSKLPNIAPFYPNEDCYYFEPLKKLSDYIEDTRRFFRTFP